MAPGRSYRRATLGRRSSGTAPQTVACWSAPGSRVRAVSEDSPTADIAGEPSTARSSPSWCRRAPSSAPANAFTGASRTARPSAVLPLAGRLRDTRRAMPENNVEIVREGFDAFNRRDVDRLVSLCARDCEWLPFRAQLEGITYRGHEGVRRFVGDMDEDWATFRIDPVDLRELDERVVAIGQVTGRGPGSGVDIDLDRWLRLRACATVESHGSRATATRATPSQPWGCRSSPRGPGGVSPCSCGPTPRGRPRA